MFDFFSVRSSFILPNEDDRQEHQEEEQNIEKKKQKNTKAKFCLLEKYHYDKLVLHVVLNQKSK